MELHLKIGAQVMMLSNDTQGRWINGTIGKIVGVSVDEDTKDDILSIELESGDTVAVRPHQWDIYRFSFNPKAGQIESNAVGSCIQYPVKLAWAVTIHKSQGKTFERVVIDIGSGTFSSGQLYVALSRCTNFEGIVLKRPVAKRHIWTDETVVNFMNTFRARMVNATQ
jgi:ATP-dependent exoDNAse (exonuclease V) alpha subunit